MNTRQALTKSVARARREDWLAQLAKDAALAALRRTAAEHLVMADKCLELEVYADAATHYEYAAAALRALSENGEAS